MSAWRPKQAVQRDRFVIDENGQQAWVERVATERFASGERLPPDGLTL